MTDPKETALLRRFRNMLGKYAKNIVKCEDGTYELKYVAGDIYLYDKNTLALYMSGDMKYKDYIIKKRIGDMFTVKQNGDSEVILLFKKEHLFEAINIADRP